MTYLSSILLILIPAGILMCGACDSHQSERQKADKPTGADSLVPTPEAALASLRARYNVVVEVSLRGHRKSELVYLVGIDGEAVDVSVFRQGVSAAFEDLYWRGNFSGGMVQLRMERLIAQLGEHESVSDSGGLDGGWVTIRLWDHDSIKSFSLWSDGSGGDEIQMVADDLIAWLQELTGVSPRSLFQTSRTPPNDPKPAPEYDAPDDPFSDE